MSKGDAIFLVPTYHPAPGKLMQQLSSEYSIVYYNFGANERIPPQSMPFEYEDLKLPKITFRGLDFAVTNTLSMFFWVLRRRPRCIVSEDYMFSLPYVVASKLIGTKLVFYNANTSPIASRRRERLIVWIKAFLLSQFDEYWHGFHGAERFVGELIGADSTLVPWIKMAAPKRVERSDQECRGIFVGEFSARKRIDFILAMYEQSHRVEFNNLSLKLMGCDRSNPLYKEEFKKLSQGLVFAEMERSDFLVLCSRREPLGSVVIEALANGLYILISKEVGSESFVRMLPSDSPLPHGVIYKNDIGCIIDADEISPVEILALLSDERLRIKSNKSKRALLVKDYFCE